MPATCLGRLAPALLILAACQPASPRFESVSDADPLLPPYAKDDGQGAMVDGAYRMRITRGTNYVFSWAPRERAAAAVQARVEHADGPANGWAGVACRVRDDSSFYAFVVSADGRRHGIVRVTGSFPVLLAGTEAAQPGPGVRLPATVRGVCDGPTLTMLVDGRPVAQAVDTVLASGRTGVVGWTDAGRAGAEYRFGQFAVDAPPRSRDALAATGARVLFQDTFEHPGSGWRADSLDDTVVEIAGGAYRVWIARDGQKRTLTKPGFGHEGDVVVEVDAVRSAGDSTTAYGVICRSTKSGGYAFLVADDGYHSIMHTGESEWQTLAEGAQSPNRIQPGPKRLRAECVGDRLALYLGGQKLLEARDSTSRRGYTDLYVDAYGQGPHEVRFDNFVLRRP